jgi:murein L,D-transpeptidase YcbB/YkuD
VHAPGAPPRPESRWAIDSAREAVQAAAADAPADVVAFYRARGWRPLWTTSRELRPEAMAVASLVQSAARDGLDPAAYDPARLRRLQASAAHGGVRDRARAEVATSSAYAAYVADLHRAPPAARLAFRDPVLAPAAIAPLAALQAAASAPDLSAAIAEAVRMHPIYAALRSALQEHPPGDPLRPLILANMGRARALPADPGRRYILVDAAAERLWLFEDGRVADTMKVIVGNRRGPTPQFAGLMRYARFQPYWNVPADIARDEIAPHVLAEGPRYLAREDLEALSGWTDDAVVLDPRTVDWRAVADGRTELRLRRRPGARNILGKVKLMLPNPLGIYLHDTPNKTPFAGGSRALSHGCIRLEDALRLTRRLLGPVADHPPPGNDARVDLPKPVPVYVLYFTLAPGPHGLDRREDVYGRDADLVAELSEGRSSGG